VVAQFAATPDVTIFGSGGILLFSSMAEDSFHLRVITCPLRRVGWLRG
jgi:hypothetical protein